jgi:hypothetical protein
MDQIKFHKIAADCNKGLLTRENDFVSFFKDFFMASI